MNTPIISTIGFRFLMAILIFCLPLVFYSINVITKDLESDKVHKYVQNFLTNPLLKPFGQPVLKIEKNNLKLESYQFSFSGHQQVYYFAIGINSSCPGVRIAATNSKGEIIHKQWDYRYHEIAHSGLVWAFLAVPRYLLPSKRFHVHVAHDPKCAKIVQPSVIPLETVNDWPALILLDYIYEDADGKLYAANTRGYQGVSVPPKPPMDWIEPALARLTKSSGNK